jgi:hypothetical protein
MVSLSPTIEPRDAAALREDALAMEAAATDLAAQIAQINTLGERHITFAAETSAGPLRVTLPVAEVASALGARLTILDLAAKAVRERALEVDRFGVAGFGAGPSLRQEIASLGAFLGQGG